MRPGGAQRGVSTLERAQGLPVTEGPDSQLPGPIEDTFGNLSPC